MENLDDISDRKAYDKLTFFYLSMPTVLIGHLLGSLLFGALLFGAVDTYNLIIWLSINVVFFLYRFYYYYKFKQENEQNKMRDNKIWTYRFYSDVLLTSVIWGSSALLLFPFGDTTNIMIMILFIFAISFTSMGNIAAKKELQLLYTLFSFTPLLIQLMIVGEEQYINLGFLVIALMIILIIISKYFGNVINSSLEEHQEFIVAKQSHDLLKERFFSLFERAPVGIFYYNEKFEILDSNIHFAELNGSEYKEDLINYSLLNTTNKELISSYSSVFDNQVGSYRGPYSSFITNTQLYVDLNTVPLLDANNNIKGGITILKDITEEVNAKENMIRNVYYDMLTNIPNRTLLMDNIDKVIKLNNTHKYFAAILYIDLDNFKKLNETFGHDKGDAALKQVTKRILKTINSDDTFARLGGDKFSILIPELFNDYDLSYQESINYAKKILQIFIKPLEIAGGDYHIGASIGVHLFNGTNDTSYDILKRSETAMYEAKRSGRNAIMFYKEDMGDNVAEFISIDNDLRKALENNELSMYYQPQVDVQSGKIIAAEALIRWKHPTKGMMPPEKFISIAEESGYIVELSHWIMKTVIKDIKALSQNSCGFMLEHIAININSLHFLGLDFSQEIKTLIIKYDIPPQWVEIEITEGVVMNNIDEAIKKMNELKNFGLKFSMDDFGTGYSSLSYLSQLPFDSLKIDQAFIRKMNNNTNDAILIYSIIDIAKNFNLSVVAEGVENIETLQMLQKSTCNIYQGYYSHRAMPFKDFSKLLSLRLETH